MYMRKKLKVVIGTIAVVVLLMGSMGFYFLFIHDWEPLYPLNISDKELTEIGVKVPRSSAVTSVEEAVQVAKQIRYPVMLRIAYALGGLGSSICMSEEEVREQASKAFAYSSQILIEEDLKGWKELEYEV